MGDVGLQEGAPLWEGSAECLAPRTPFYPVAAFKEGPVPETSGL